MTEKHGAVTFMGQPMTLVGNTPSVGMKAPDFTVVGADLKPVKLADTHGIRIFTTVPSLDTPVCDAQARRFNQEAAKLPDVSIYVISADLPFAQARWCGAAGIDKIKTLSDYMYMSFGDSWGLHIKELRLLARSVFVVDSTGVITYAELVKEIGDSPNFEAALAAVKKAK